MVETRTRQEARRQRIPEIRRGSDQTRAERIVDDMQARIKIKSSSERTTSANLRAEAGGGGLRRASKIERRDLPSHEAP